MPALPPGGAPPVPPSPAMPPMGAMDGAGGPGYGLVPRSSLRHAIRLLRRQGESDPRAASPFAQAQDPINLLQQTGLPPTVKGVPAPDKSQKRDQFMPNIGGHNRQPGAKVNTDISSGNKTASVHSGILNRTFNIQR